MTVSTSDDKDVKDRADANVTLTGLGSSSEREQERETRAESNVGVDNAVSAAQPQYRLYKRRHAGVLGIIALNVVAGMNLTWFGPIANKTSQTFGITLDQVNWLGNIVGCTYILVAPIVPFICSRFGLRISYAIGTCSLILSAWVRFAGTARSLDSRGAYALLIIGQFLSAIPQIIFQVLAPKFSETWFDFKGRTTATMLMSVSNPVGTALGQLISPMISSARTSILVLGIISTAVAPFALLVGAKPPTPPSYSGSHASYPFLTTLHAIFGLLPRSHSCVAKPFVMEYGSGSEASPDPGIKLDSPLSKSSTTRLDPTADGHGHVLLGDHPIAMLEADREEEEEEAGAYMTLRERLDFVVLTIVFSVLVAGVNTFSILSNEILEPYGYSEDTAGLMGAALLLAGLVAAFATAPLFDRVLTHHLGLSVRIAVPIVAAGWLSLIWAVRPHNAGALFAIFAVIGVFSISMLPVALELGCELTRNSDASSAILWCSANIASIVFILVMSALRASLSASPPQNMHHALIFNGASICGGSVFVLLLRGHQRRREKDAQVAADADAAAVAITESSMDQGREDRESREVEGSDTRKVKSWRGIRMPLGMFSSKTR